MSLEEKSIKLINDMFEDKINNLTREQQEIEIMKFREGLAPDNPSFIVNQEEVVEKLKKSFEELYLKSMNMQSWMLVSDYGNGKSHILNTIKSNLEPIKSNIVISTYAKAQSPFIPIQEILKHINREIIRKYICKYILTIQGEKNEKDIQINSIMTKLNSSKELAKLLWYMTNGKVDEQIKALDVLTQQDISRDILKDLDISYKENIFTEIDDFFYILMKCLKSEKIYVIFLIEEFENVFKWRKKEKDVFFEQLKELMNNGTVLGNMFLLLVATNIFNDEIDEKRNKGREIKGIDPAVYDRLKAKALKLNFINNREEAIKLINKIKERYELFYGCKINTEMVMNQLTEKVKNVNYRSYIQTITLIMDDIVEGKVDESFIPKVKFEDKVEILRQKEEKICNVMDDVKEEVNSNKEDNSLVIKKKFISAITRLLELNGYKIQEQGIKIKAGYIIAKPKNKKNNRMFFIAYSSSINSSFIYKKLQICEKTSLNNRCDKNNVYFIYCKSSVSAKIDKKIQEYNPATIRTISLENDDFTRILLLSSEKIEDDEKINIAIEYGKYMNLEV